MSGPAPRVFKPRYDKGLRLALVILIVLPLGRAASLFVSGEPLLAWLMLVVTGLASLVLWSVLPRAFELWPGRIRIVLGLPWALNITLAEIVEIRCPTGLAPWARMGAMFATSFKAPVQIKLKDGMTLLISPDDQSGFIERVEQALRSDRESAAGRDGLSVP